MSATRIQCFDRAELARPVRRPDGTVIYDGRFTRVGVFEYDEAPKLRLRLPEHVFAPASLDTLKHVPVVLHHPRDEQGQPVMVTGDNARKYRVGHVGEAVRVSDDTFIDGPVVVQDAEANAAIDSGTRALSNAYECELVMQSGVHPEYGPYDCIQTNIVHNHLAIEDAGRAGATARLCVDAKDKKDPMSTRAIVVAGKAFTLSIDAADAVEAALKATPTVDALQAKFDALNDALTARATELATARAENAKLTADRAAFRDSPEFKAAVTGRVALIATARKFLGDAAVKDDAADLDIKRAVIAKRMPAVSLDGRPEAGIDALYEASIHVDGAAATLAALGAGATPPSAPGAGALQTDVDLEAARKKRFSGQRASATT